MAGPAHFSGRLMTRFVVVRGMRYQGRNVVSGDVIDGPVKHSLISAGRVRQLADSPDSPVLGKAAQIAPEPAEQAQAQLFVPVQEPVREVVETTPQAEDKPVAEVRHFGRKRRG